MAIGLATLRRDGFASVQASYDGGTLMTRPFALAGTQLRVNAKASYGRVRVELLDEQERVLPGFGAGDCVPIEADGVDLPVRWGADGRQPLPPGPARLRFHLHNARLYAYWTAPG